MATLHITLHMSLTFGIPKNTMCETTLQLKHKRKLLTTKVQITINISTSYSETDCTFLWQNFKVILCLYAQPMIKTDPDLWANARQKTQPQRIAESFTSINIASL